jgi:hypothetical protein
MLTGLGMTAAETNICNTGHCDEYTYGHDACVAAWQNVMAAGGVSAFCAPAPAPAPVVAAPQPVAVTPQPVVNAPEPVVVTPPPPPNTVASDRSCPDAFPVGHIDQYGQLICEKTTLETASLVSSQQPSQEYYFSSGYQPGIPPAQISTAPLPAIPPGNISYYIPQPPPAPLPGSLFTELGTTGASSPVAIQAGEQNVAQGGSVAHDVLGSYGIDNKTLFIGAIVLVSAVMMARGSRR